MTIIELLVLFIIIALVFWCIRKIVDAFKVPDPIAAVVYVVFTIICVLYLLGRLGFANIRIL